MGSRGQVSGRLVALERGYDWMELHGDEAPGGLGAKVNTAWGLHGGGGGRRATRWGTGAERQGWEAAPCCPPQLCV